MQQRGLAGAVLTDKQVQPRAYFGIGGIHGFYAAAIFVCEIVKAIHGLVVQRAMMQRRTVRRARRNVFIVQCLY